MDRYNKSHGTGASSRCRAMPGNGMSPDTTSGSGIRSHATSGRTTPPNRMNHGSSDRYGPGRRPSSPNRSGWDLDQLLGGDATYTTLGRNLVDGKSPSGLVRPPFGHGCLAWRPAAFDLGKKS